MMSPFSAVSDRYLFATDARVHRLIHGPQNGGRILIPSFERKEHFVRRQRAIPIAV